MEFKIFRNIENGFKQIRMYTLVFASFCLLISLFSVGYAYHFAQQQREKIYVLDNGKSLMLALSQDTKINRPVEAREHIRRFHELFFNVAPDKKAIDTQGNKVWERELDIYCRVRKEFTSDDVANRRSGFMPFLYQGQYYDVETELAYNRFRYYDPNTGSYISRYKPYGVLPWSVCVPR